MQLSMLNLLQEQPMRSVASRCHIDDTGGESVQCLCASSLKTDETNFGPLVDDCFLTTSSARNCSTVMPKVSPKSEIRKSLASERYNSESHGSRH